MAEKHLPASDEQEPGITEEKLDRLPRWARVAFAARCARRVQPLYVHAWLGAPQEHVDALDQANTLAEQASIKAVQPAFAKAVAAVENAENAAAGANAGKAVAAAAASGAAVSGDAAKAVAAAGSAAAIANVANASIADIDARMHEVTAHAMRRDFKLLAEAARRFNWTDDTPVHPKFFGPLWPEGEPEEWPKQEQPDESNEPRKLILQIAVLENTPDEELDAAVQEQVLAASELHKAMSGSGLKVNTIRVFEPANVPQEVGS